MTPDFWLNLQRMYDLDVACAKTDLSAIEPLVQAPDQRPSAVD
jgi:plasmid maintenance system antidote protein VapI